MQTSWHTSARRFARRSQISLCQMMVNLPDGQVKVCSIVKFVPQTQLVGV